MTATSDKVKTDVLVIGGGPGGYTAAIRAAQLGKTVTLAERAELGGVCLNWGCIPTKAILKSADVYATVQGAASYGVSVGQPSVSYGKVIERSRKVADTLSRGVAFLMKKNKVRVVKGSARLVGPGAARVTDSNGAAVADIEAGHIILATGARTRRFPGLEIGGHHVISSREALVLTELPESIVIVGAGAIGVEFAHIYATFGCQVTVVEMLDVLLPQADADISRELLRWFKRRKIKVLTSTRIQAIDRSDGKAVVSIEQAGQTGELQADKVLLATGVQGNIEDLGLRELGIETEHGWVLANEYLQTNVPRIYAIGDVVGNPCLAHVASAQGVRVADHLAGRPVVPVDELAVPACVYCNPQVASVGHTEASAREAGYDVTVGRFPFKASGKALALGDTAGFVKVIVDRSRGHLLGCHIIGPEATELIMEFTLARSVHATHLDILSTVHPHPTLSEAVQEAVADAFGEALNI